MESPDGSPAAASPRRAEACRACRAPQYPDALFCHRCGSPVFPWMPSPIPPAWPAAPYPAYGYAPYLAPQVRPTTPQSRGPFRAGFLGDLVLALACGLAAASLVGQLFSGMGGIFFMREYPLIPVFAQVLAGVALCLAGIGQFGYYTNFRAGAGAAAGVAAVTGGALFALLIPFGVERRDFGFGPQDFWTVNILLWLVAYVAFGVGAIFLGAGRIALRRLGPDAGVAMGSGIALIVGGSLMCSFVLGAILPAAWFVLMAAAIASAVVSYRMGFGREAPAPSMPYAQPVIPPR